MTYSTKNKGFTLVELAIVIVIIGFLVAGIAAGANMIRQAELRSLITDMRLYQVAYNNFIGRFNKVPGDMEVASSFWPAASGAASCAVTPANCNGDGNGRITHGVNSATNEVMKAWKQLALAGTISAGIVQIPDVTTGIIAIGTQAPTSKKSGAGFFMGAGGSAYGGSGLTSQFATTTNAVFIGAGGTAAAALVAPILTTEEAFNLDVKLDDGLVSGAGVFSGANTGVVRAHNGQGVANTATNRCVDNSAASHVYDLTTTAGACIVGLALN